MGARLTSSQEGGGTCWECRFRCGDGRCRKILEEGVEAPHYVDVFVRGDFGCRLFKPLKVRREASGGCSR